MENLFTVDCEELDDLIAVLEEGIRNRSMGRHNMNDYSRYYVHHLFDLVIELLMVRLD